MKILFSILVLFSQAFAIVINTSNIAREFVIDDLEGVGSIAIPEEFKIMLKLKLVSDHAPGIDIIYEFYNYIVGIHYYLNFLEKEALLRLISMYGYAKSDLVPIEIIPSIVMIQ